MATDTGNTIQKHVVHISPYGLIHLLLLYVLLPAFELKMKMIKTKQSQGLLKPHLLTYDLIEIVKTQVLSVDLGIIHRCQVASILHHDISTELHQQLQTGQMTMEGSNVEWSHFTGCQRRANIRISYNGRVEGERVCRIERRVRGMAVQSRMTGLIPQ